MVMIVWYICFDPKTVSFKPFRFVTKMYVGVYLHEFVSRDGDLSLILYICICICMYVCMYIYIYMYKGKVTPLQARCGPEVG